MSRMGEPKISDFGLSRMTNYSQQKLLSSTPDGSKGTVLWMAPELFGIDDDSDVRPSKASDMWAYGMVVYVCTSAFFLDVSTALLECLRKSSQNSGPIIT